jgi:hypothetical protein
LLLWSQRVPTISDFPAVSLKCLRRHTEQQRVVLILDQGFIAKDTIKSVEFGIATRLNIEIEDTRACGRNAALDID